MDATKIEGSLSAASVWNGGLRLGWAPIDALHEEFVNLVRAVLDASDEDVGEALRAVRIHTEGQFASEERWMQEAGFPTFGFHADEHAAVLASMMCVSRKITAGDTNAARVFARALMEWFAGHAHDLDSALARWITSKSLRGKSLADSSRGRVRGTHQVPAPAHGGDTFLTKEACSAGTRAHERTTCAAQPIIPHSAMPPKAFMHLMPLR